MEEEAAQEQEDRHAQSLRQARAQEEQALAGQTAVANSEEVKKLQGLVENKEKVVQFVLMSLLAVGNDALDLMGIGAVPIVGDIVDLGAGAGVSALLFSFEGHPRWKAQAIIWAATIFELIPLGVNDLVPTDTLGIVVIYALIVSAGRKASEKLEAMGVGT